MGSTENTSKRVDEIGCESPDDSEESVNKKVTKETTELKCSSDPDSDDQSPSSSKTPYLNIQGARPRYDSESSTEGGKSPSTERMKR